MEQLTTFIGYIVMIVGLATVIIICANVFIWAIQEISEHIVKTRVIYKAKFYIEDTNKRIRECEKRVDALENNMNGMTNDEKQ